MAKLHFKYGAMNCGKSDTLIKTAFNYTETGLEIAVIKPSIDTKDDTAIVARPGGRLEPDILATPETQLRQELTDLIGRRAINKLNCVLVDEAQFLTPPQIDDLYDTAKLDDTSVIAYGLRTDFQTRVFPGSLRLLELADNIEKLPTMCANRCGSQGEFNTRKINGLYVFEGDQVAIDGQDDVEYDSLCGVCRRKAQLGL
ncbi:MAG TPA: thymidine kinase [Candidatus Saccharimonadales bacterium]|nr:thymidine kinase [Candidatus Saccharimonadales bacterium]